MQTDILVIDDEQVIIESVARLSASEGWEADTALDAKAGLKFLNHKKYRLIICDIMMPEIDGFMFLEELKKRDIDTPVIITTGYSTVENAVKSLNTGAIDFLAKPFTFDELISCIKRSFRLMEFKEARESVEKTGEEEILFVPCPDNYKRLGYSSWALLDEDGSVRIGVTDILMRTIGSLNDLELFQKDDEIIQGNPCLHIISDDQLQHPILSPMTGRVIEENEAVKNDLSLIEKDPYFQGWIYRIIPSSLEYEIKHLTPCSVDLF